ncbi:MAG: antibiotic biosynthesis monooxygenase, partial [bacterium]
ELIQSRPNTDNFMSLTFWENQEAAEHYEKSGAYKKLLEKCQPYLAESSGLTLQLSDSLELEYKPIPEEPRLKEYDISTQSDQSPQPVPGMHVRIVSVKIHKNKIDEFKHLYNTVILHTLRGTKGCMYAFLTENMQESNEFISITGWESKEDVDHYEKSGQFARLVEKVEHTFSQVYLWKMANETDTSRKMVTSDDLSVTYFRMVKGKNFSQE